MLTLNCSVGMEGLNISQLYNLLNSVRTRKQEFLQEVYFCLFFFFTLI